MADKRVTLSGRPPETPDAGAPAPIDPATGLHKDYWVLSEEERRKGYVRPVRTIYTHVGRSICGKPMEEDKDVPLPEGKAAFLCTGEPGHDKACYIWTPVTDIEFARFVQTGRLGGCDWDTFMHAALAETYARDPGFYSATFCAVCRAHLPVGAYGEFVWKGTNERVGA